MSKIYNNILNKIWKRYAPDVGKSLIHLGALGWFLSSAAQLGMIISNKDIDKKEKQFLVPQEAADGCINVGLYYTICQAIKKGGDALLERGKIIAASTLETINSLKPDSNTMPKYLKAMSDAFEESSIIGNDNIKSSGRLNNFLNGSIEFLEKTKEEQTRIMQNSGILRSTFEKVLEQSDGKELHNTLTQSLKDYSLFKNGVGVITAVGASILACNIITPLARNYTASLYQKRALKRQNKLPKTENNKPVFYNYNQIPVSKTFSGFRI